MQHVEKFTCNVLISIVTTSALGATVAHPACNAPPISTCAGGGIFRGTSLEFLSAGVLTSLEDGM